MLVGPAITADADRAASPAQAIAINDDFHRLEYNFSAPEPVSRTCVGVVLRDLTQFEYNSTANMVVNNPKTAVAGQPPFRPFTIITIPKRVKTAPIEISVYSRRLLGFSN